MVEHTGPARSSIDRGGAKREGGRGESVLCPLRRASVTGHRSRSSVVPGSGSRRGPGRICAVCLRGQRGQTGYVSFGRVVPLRRRSGGVIGTETAEDLKMSKTKIFCIQFILAGADPGDGHWGGCPPWYGDAPFKIPTLFDMIQAPVHHWAVGALFWEKSCIRPCLGYLFRL